MKKQHYLALFVVGLLLVISSVPTLAQTAVDTQLVDLVKAAFDNTLAATSLTVNVASKTETAEAT
ncbi:MAG TPA: hypothetical protein VHO69_09010, partial [Phototrophicaceae bacterium]|nr:hypothetical protein [Phototrophicaceae bacterium]